MKGLFKRSWFGMITIVLVALGGGLGKAGAQTALSLTDAVAQALAPPPVALEWCLPLVREGGRVILLTGEVDVAAAAAAAEAVGGGRPELVPLAGSERRSLLVVPKVGPTPARFPRRPGVARKRPLA